MQREYEYVRESWQTGRQTRKYLRGEVTYEGVYGGKKLTVEKEDNDRSDPEMRIKLHVSRESVMGFWRYVGASRLSS